MSDTLDTSTRDAALRGLPAWTYDATADAIKRRFVFQDFSEAFGFVCRVGLLAEAAGHHPDWSNVYNRVTIALRTHDADGVTGKDIGLATAIDALLPASGS